MKLNDKLKNRDLQNILRIYCSKCDKDCDTCSLNTYRRHKRPWLKVVVDSIQNYCKECKGIQGRFDDCTDRDCLIRNFIYERDTFGATKR